MPGQVGPRAVTPAVRGLLVWPADAGPAAVEIVEVSLGDVDTKEVDGGIGLLLHGSARRGFGVDVASGAVMLRQRAAT